MSRPDDHPIGDPKFSVVIPVYNDPDGIRLTLESVTGQTYPSDDYEIIVVDNGSDDRTRDVIETYCERYPDLVTLLVEDEIQGSYAARNKGIRHARGSIVAFIDADMTVGTTWAASVMASHEKHGWNYMGCEIETYTEGPASLTATYDRALGFTVQRYLQEAHFVVTACLSVEKSVFDEVGTFDARLISGGDVEFGKRVHAAGLKQFFEPAITVYHPARTTMRSWLEKQFRVGQGASQRRRYYPEQTESSHPLAPQKFLPLRPRGFCKRLKSRMNPALQDTVALYGLGYLSKLARATGGVYERYLVDDCKNRSSQHEKFRDSD